VRSRKVLRSDLQGDRTPVAKPFKKPHRNMHRLSRFAKLMKGLPRDRFQALTDQHAGDRYVKRFGCWQQLLAMVYAQVAGLSSLREVETGFNQHRNHHYHLGAQPLRRSTLADANESRNPKVFEETLKLLIGSAGAKIRSDRRELLYLIDSTTIPLYGRGLQWAQATATRTRGLKVHIQLEGSALVPVHFLITAANVNDATVGSQIVPEPGATYVFDKGYCDYKWWERIALASARFVTRLKKNAAIEVLKIQQIPGDESQLVSDCVIVCPRKATAAGIPTRAGGGCVASRCFGQSTTTTSCSSPMTWMRQQARSPLSISSAGTSNCSSSGSSSTSRSRNSWARTRTPSAFRSSRP
jgi:hypothetical protein